MFLTMLLIDFFHEDFSARCCRLRSSRDEPFWVLTGDYRPLPTGATGLEIGAEIIDGDGWSIRRDGPGVPVDEWLARSDERVNFRISYFGVTAPMAGIGAYNLVLPRGWRFDDLKVNNPNHNGPEDMVARDDEDDREAVILYFQGANTRFNLTIQAIRGSRDSDSRDLGVPIYSRRIVEPSPADTDKQSDLEDASTHARPTVAPVSNAPPATGTDAQGGPATGTHTPPPPPPPDGVELKLVEKKFVGHHSLAEDSGSYPISVFAIFRWRIVKMAGPFVIDLAELRIRGWMTQREPIRGSPDLEDGFVVASFEFDMRNPPSDRLLGVLARLRGVVTLQDSNGKTHRDKVNDKVHMRR
jgi:hypothetical protein